MHSAVGVGLWAPLEAATAPGSAAGGPDPPSRPERALAAAPATTTPTPSTTTSTTPTTTTTAASTSAASAGSGESAESAGPSADDGGLVDDLTAGLTDAFFDSAVGDFADNFDNDGDSGLVEKADKPEVVDNPADPGRDAWRFSLDGGGKRSEVLPKGPGTEPTDGDEQWVRYSAVLGDDFPVDTDRWQLILQWHHDSWNGSPPLALQVTHGELRMVSEGTDMQTIGPVAPGQRIDLVMHVVFDRDPDEGVVTVWRDGEPTGVTGWHPPDGTMSTKDAYLKMGMYRSPDISRPGSVTVTDLKIGPTARSIGGTGDLPG